MGDIETKIEIMIIQCGKDDEKPRGGPHSISRMARESLPRVSSLFPCLTQMIGGRGKKKERNSRIIIHEDTQVRNNMECK